MTHRADHTHLDHETDDDDHGHAGHDVRMILDDKLVTEYGQVLVGGTGLSAFDRGHFSRCQGWVSIWRICRNEFRCPRGCHVGDGERRILRKTRYECVCVTSNGCGLHREHRRTVVVGPLALGDLSVWQSRWPFTGCWCVNTIHLSSVGVCLHLSRFW